MNINSLPKLARKLCLIHGAWIVGSAANPLNIPKDIDILVPFHKWREVAIVIPSWATPNTFGGWKFAEDGTLYDVWPGDLSVVLADAKTEYAWHPKSTTWFKISR